MTTPHAPPPNEKRNFYALFFDVFFFGTALSIIDPSTTIPAFVGHLTQETWLIGLASASFYTLWLAPQLLAARPISRSQTRKPWVIWPGFLARLLFFSLAALIVWIGPNHPQFLLWSFLITCMIARMIEGVVATAWSDLLGSSLQARSRSRVLGYAQVLQGPFIAIAALTIVPFVLSRYTFPYNFALLFAISGLLMIAGWLSLIQVQERPPQHLLQLPPLKEYPRYLLQIIQKDPPFGRFLVVRLLFDIANGASIFYTVYALKVLRLPSSEILGHFVLLLIAGRVFAALTLTPLIERWHQRFGIWAGLTFLSLHLLCAIAATFSPMPYALTLLSCATFLRGSERCTWSLGFFGWVIDHAPDNQRPLYIGLANLATAIGQLSPLLAGFLLLFLSYPSLFALSLALTLCAFFLSRRLP